MMSAITRVDESNVSDRMVQRSEITSTLIQGMGSYLDRKRGKSVLASRADIDPCELVSSLPYIVLVDIHTDPLRVFYRLVGTKIAEFHGEFTGTWMHQRQISNAYRRIAENIYLTLIRTKQPIFGVTEMPTRWGAIVSYEWGYFPLSADGVNVTGGLEIESPDRHIAGMTAPAVALKLRA
jgi:hypothetical protein